jgi:hypothetical protein
MTKGESINNKRRIIGFGLFLAISCCTTLTLVLLASRRYFVDLGGYEHPVIASRPFLGLSTGRGIRQLSLRLHGYENGRIRWMEAAPEVLVVDMKGPKANCSGLLLLAGNKSRTFITLNNQAHDALSAAITHDRVFVRESGDIVKCINLKSHQVITIPKAVDVRGHFNSRNYAELLANGDIERISPHSAPCLLFHAPWLLNDFNSSLAPYWDYDGQTGVLALLTKTGEVETIIGGRTKVLNTPWPYHARTVALEPGTDRIWIGADAAVDYSRLVVVGLNGQIIGYSTGGFGPPFYSFQPVSKRELSLIHLWFKPE